MNAFKFSLQDAFAVLSIVIVVAYASYQWHQFSLEDAKPWASDSTTPEFRAARDAIVESWSLPIALFHSTCAVSGWLTVRRRDDIHGCVIGFAFYIPLVTAPLFPAVPTWILTGYPVLIIMGLACCYGVAFRVWAALWLFALTIVWFVLAVLYHGPWWSLIGD